MANKRGSVSCKACEEFQESSATFYYRWKNANIEVRGCEAHLREVFDALNEYREEKAALVKGQES